MDSGGHKMESFHDIMAFSDTLLNELSVKIVQNSVPAKPVEAHFIFGLNDCSFRFNIIKIAWHIKISGGWTRDLERCLFGYTSFRGKLYECKNQTCRGSQVAQELASVSGDPILGPF
jgi:hypothetical protein